MSRAKAEAEEDIGISSSYTHFSETHHKEILRLLERVYSEGGKGGGEGGGGGGGRGGGGGGAGDAGKTTDAEACIPGYEAEKIFERFRYILDLYQEQPQLLDPHLSEILNPLLNNVREVSSLPAEKATTSPKAQLSFQVLGHLTKVRGYKVMLRHLPHEVQDLKPVLSLLEAQDMNNMSAWAARYMLLLWLVILCQNPFELRRFDSTTDKKSIIDRLLEISYRYLSTAEKSRDIAALLRAHIVTRNDVKATYLESELRNGIHVLKTTKTSGKVAIQIHEPMGICSFLAQVLKHGQRGDLLPHAPFLLEEIQLLKLEDVNQTLIRKLGIKLITRIGLIFLKPRVANWRYCRGNRKLADNLTGTDTNITQNAPSEAKIEVEEEEEDIPEEVETVMDILITNLKDKDTIVRWSAAKGLGRLTARLPRELADDVISSILELFRLGESDGAWHGGCLALAELGRRGFLLPSRLPEVVPILIKALVFDEQQGRHSVGSHVRDAACYLCWSFARAYDPTELQPFVEQLASALLIVTVYDREVNCRRAASAAFQENVGRQGSLPHGIEILTVADYFAVGQRGKCYRELSVFVAGFPEYSENCLQHLLDEKVGHWDEEIRQLAAESLGNLTKLHSDYMIRTALPKLLPQTVGVDLFARQGSLFAIGEICAALKDPQHSLETKTTFQICSVPGEIRRKLLLKGMGADLIRTGINQFVRKLSSCLFPINPNIHHEKDNLPNIPQSTSQEEQNDEKEGKLKILGEWLFLIKDNLKHTEEDMRKQAAEALVPLAAYFLKIDHNRSAIDNIISDCLNQLKTGDKETDRMGAALALGAFSADFLGKRGLDEVSNILATMAMNRTGETDKTWAEARRDCVMGLNAIYKDLLYRTQPGNQGDSVSSKEFAIMLPRIRKRCFECYIEGMEDYTIDSRGDIGKVVREACMLNLRDHILSLLPLSLPTPQEADDVFAMLLKSVCKLIQQSAEKIDSTRKFAGEVLTELLIRGDWLLGRLPHRKLLISIYPPSRYYLRETEKGFSNVTDVKWMSGAETFPRLAPLLEIPEYRYHSLLGFIISAGGLTESTMKAALDTLLTYAGRVAEDEKELEAFLRVLTDIFLHYKDCERVVSPFLTVLDHILSYGYLEVYTGRADSIPELNQLLELSIEVTARKKSPQKVVKGVAVCCGYLQFENTSQLWSRSIKQILKTLSHRYPFVRRETAEKFYQALLTYGCLDNHNEIVMDLLGNTDWDRDPKDCKEIRQEMSDRFGVPM